MSTRFEARRCRRWWKVWDNAGEKWAEHGDFATEADAQSVADRYNLAQSRADAVRRSAR